MVWGYAASSCSSPLTRRVKPDMLTSTGDVHDSQPIKVGSVGHEQQRGQPREVGMLRNVAGMPEHYGLPVAAVDVPLPAVEAGVVHKHVVHAIYVAMEVAHLVTQHLLLCSPNTSTWSNAAL